MTRSITGLRAAVGLLLVLTALLGAYLLWVPVHVRSHEQFGDRLGTDSPNRFFGDRIPYGMIADDVPRAIPPADHVNFYLMQDGSVVQQFVYALEFTRDYEVSVVISDGRVADVEYSEEYLGPITPISRDEAMKLIRKQ